MAYCTFVRGYMPAPHHEVIIERLIYGGRFELILGPPDTAKTQYGTMFLEWTIGRNPNFRWLVASEIATGIATDIVTEVMETLEGNERYIATFGYLKGNKWGAKGIRVCEHTSKARSLRTGLQPSPDPPFDWLPPRGRRPGLRGDNAKPVGWRTGYTGARAEGLMGDDLVSDKSSHSAVITTAVYRTLHQKMIARLTGDDPRVILFGQRWAPRDLFGLLSEVGHVVYDNNPGMEGLQALAGEEEG